MGSSKTPNWAGWLGRGHPSSKLETPSGRWLPDGTALRLDAELAGEAWQTNSGSRSDSRTGSERPDGGLRMGLPRGLAAWADYAPNDAAIGQRAGAAFCCLSGNATAV